ncbi:alpha/beta hydrolase [Promineifilum sp.]|uniref:alpha/beta hydrolase n=1 Tax=Promineifilum sp. TaxID=2664178 RepID=UPI0035AEE8FE
MITVAGYVLLLFGLFIVAGVAYQAIAVYREQRLYPAPGQRIDIGGRKLHIHCTGQGRPTVVLEAALSGTSLDWGWVQPEVAKFTRVCSYDRAGYGWSDPGPLPRDSETLASELRTLLDRAGVDGPYVLVGHSMAGYHVRAFADRFRNEVVGLVLVDVSHEDMFSYWPAEYLRLDQQQIAMGRFGAPFGLVRLADRVGLVPEIGKFVKKHPPTTQGALRSFLYRRAYFETWKDELDVQARSAAQARMTQPLGEMPLGVLTAGAHTVPGEGDSGETERRWMEHQRKLAALSSNSIHVHVDKSDHYIQLDAPDQVVEMIYRVVEAARQRQR